MEINILKETLKRLESAKLVLVEERTDPDGNYTAVADQKYEQAVKDALKFAIAGAKDSESADIEDVVPLSKELKKDLDHVKLICKAFMWDKEWYDGTNPYAGRSSVYEKTVPTTDGKETTVYSFSKVRGNPKKLFEPTDAEIQAALDEFKKKGWHAQYDREVGYYVVFEGTRSLGEHSARYTRNLF